ncbi:MAG TPA: hypothetical protein VE820_10575 [Sphingomicrobium sp.]|jgi:hypothetical protein|nr:hypothetical protein [Sphingomicrobium sp.]
MKANSGAQSAGEDGLAQSDRLIQLDELIKWVRRQAQVKLECDAALTSLLRRLSSSQ